MPMSDFKSGVTAPPFHPNCRSVTVPYLDDSSEKYSARVNARRGTRTARPFMYPKI
ncbi:MAG: hypothetical protein IJR45_08985 [Firmicutes bacterium]|nr:hypothetical protein [Bacillota bacterium]